VTQRGNLDLIIARLPALKKRQRVRLCQKFSREEDFLCLSYRDILCETGAQAEFDVGIPLWNIDEVRRQAERDRQLMEARNIQIVSISEEQYPPLLREIYDPPAVLFYRGDFTGAFCAKKMLAVVGTRKPSSEALELCYCITLELGQAGISVVSGMALGIDAMAHRGNCDGGGATIAVLGSAADMIYPSANRQLAQRILERGGVLLSEYPPGTPPQRWHFPERNRIISGLCSATLVVEAPRKSGALITADFALEHDRDLWVAAGVEGPLGDGCLALADDGAKIVHSAEDVLLEWGIPPRKSTAQLSLAANLARELELDDLSSLL
jgi:DNA processing protein